MDLKEQLLRRKGNLVQAWFDLLLETYPVETARFLRREKDRFANPVGSTLYRGIEGLYEALLQGVNRDEINRLMESIVKIRAVQEQSPSRAVGFVFLLKQLVRQELAVEIRGGRISLDDLSRLESEIDDLALISFDMYAACREKLYNIRVDQLAGRTERLLQRAKVLADSSDPEPDPTESALIP